MNEPVSIPLPPNGVSESRPSLEQVPDTLSVGAEAHGAASSAGAARPKRKTFWTKQFYLWHWVSSAVCLVSMLFFAFTGITLNHAADIPAKPEVTARNLVLPDGLLREVAMADGGAEAADAERKAPLPVPVASWLSEALGHSVAGRTAEWSAGEIYLSLPRPGGDAWLTIDRETGAVACEITRRGAVSYLNDLHKGRHTGKAWAWFLDIFSAMCVVFCLTGLGLLWIHARRRPSTWPVIAAGVVIPVLILIFLVH